MRWRGGRKSDNIEDRRGASGRMGGGAKIGGGAILLLALFALLTGQDPSQLVEVIADQQRSAPSQSGPPAGGANDEQSEFISVILASTEDTWAQLYNQAGGRYRPPTLVLFTDAVQSACGYNSAAVGPFYCPGDEKVYIDLGFYRDLRDRFGAPGDFAQAYVIAHEIGHHIQKLEGIAEKAHRARGRMSEADGNALSVLQELQADCYAGVWAHHAQRRLQWLESGDVEEGLNAAAAIGDDRLQRQAGGRIHPESWTHGSSAQRVEWFRRGLEFGQVDQCDTFASSGR